VLKVKGPDIYVPALTGKPEPEHIILSYHV